MVTQILVPLDGSPDAEQALCFATALCRRLEAELVLLQAVPVPFCVEEGLRNAGLDETAFLEQLEGRACDYLRRVARRLVGTGLTVIPVARRGQAERVIVEVARHPSVRLIVMATHGYTGMRRWQHASVAERVLHEAGVPVILIRERETKAGVPDPVPFRRVLAPLDGSVEAERALGPAAAIVRACNGEMVLFHVPIVYVCGSLIGEWVLPVQGDSGTAIQDGQAYLARVAGRLRREGLRVSTALQIGGVAESIVEYAEANRIDLIAICTHGRTAVGRWALGGVADRVLRAGDIPVLLVRNKPQNPLLHVHGRTEETTVDPVCAGEK